MGRIKISPREKEAVMRKIAEHGRSDKRSGRFHIDVIHRRSCAMVLGRGPCDCDFTVTEPRMTAGPLRDLRPRLN